VLLTSTSTGAYDIAVYTGTGSGTFGTAVLTAAGSGTGSGTQPDSIAAADFSGDGKTDVVFATDDHLLDLMLATSGGSMSSATSLTLPSGHLAIGVTTIDYNADGKADLAVSALNTNLMEGTAPFVSLDLLTGNGSGGFSDTATIQTIGEMDFNTVGLVAGNFQGSSTGLEIAVPITNGGANGSYLEIVPLSSAAAWGSGLIEYVGTYPESGSTTAPQAGNIVAADFNGSGKPSIALVNSGNGQIEVLLADPAATSFCR
jgi:hypothetical protein